MKISARILVLLLAACFLFASCDSAPGTTSENTGNATAAVTGTVEETVPESTEEGSFEPLTDLNMNGEEFVIIVPPSAAGAWNQHMDFDAPELNEDPVNDANYERISKLKELYNVTIVNKVTSGKVIDDARKCHNAGDNEYDAIHLGITEAPVLAQEGFLVDLNTLESMNLENPWYNQSAVEQMSIGGKLFFVLGDISTVDNDGIGCITFNKGMIEDGNLTSPYDLIKENKWTIDNFYELCKGYAYDLDGDGDMNIMDRWGYLTAYSSIFLQLNACGVRIVEKDEDDLPHLCINSSRTLEAIEKVLALYIDKQTTFHVNEMKNIPGGVSGWQYGNNMFMEGRVMFREVSMYRAIQCREMEEDFGIIPYPKLDSEQENYAHSFSTATPVICILSTADDPEVNGAVIEALSYYGRTIVRPAYYDRVLKGLVARDEDSEFCLDLIFDTADYDLGLVLNLGNLISVFSGYVNARQSTFASDYASLETTMNSQIADYVEAYENVLN
ncbi:MAG: hypothetical protein E7665_06935 [Ruminococcaceae bacterium]|nr:hypothetical protein [Oscillospiraceae bacterium]